MTARRARPDAQPGGPRRLRPAGLAAMITIVAAMTSGCEDTGIGAGELADRTFVATELDGASLAEGTALTLAFTNDAVTASAGCNAIRATVEAAEENLDVDDVTRSELACPGAVASLEDWLVAFLGERPTIDIADGTLRLVAPSGTVTAVEVS